MVSQESFSIRMAFKITDPGPLDSWSVFSSSVIGEDSMLLPLQREVSESVKCRCALYSDIYCFVKNIYNSFCQNKCTMFKGSILHIYSVNQFSPIFRGPIILQWTVLALPQTAISYLIYTILQATKHYPSYNCDYNSKYKCNYIWLIKFELQCNKLSVHC